MNMEIELAPGEYRVFTSKALETPSLPTTSEPETLGSSGIFPNPAVDYIVVESESVPESIVLRDISGRVIRELPSEGRKTTIGISDLIPGIYVLELKHNHGNVFHRFIK